MRNRIPTSKLNIKIFPFFFETACLKYRIFAFKKIASYCVIYNLTLGSRNFDNNKKFRVLKIYLACLDTKSKLRIQTNLKLRVCRINSSRYKKSNFALKAKKQLLLTSQYSLFYYMKMYIQNFAFNCANLL